MSKAVSADEEDDELPPPVPVKNSAGKAARAAERQARKVARAGKPKVNWGESEVSSVAARPATVGSAVKTKMVRLELATMAEDRELAR